MPGVGTAAGDGRNRRATTLRILGAVCTVTAVLMAAWTAAFTPAFAEDDAGRSGVEIVDAPAHDGTGATPGTEVSASPGPSPGSSPEVSPEVASADSGDMGDTGDTGDTVPVPSASGTPQPSPPGASASPGPEAAAQSAAPRDRRTRRGARARALRQTCPPTSIICIENSLPGSPPSQWDVPGSGSAAIAGFPTQMSVNAGETEQFKVLAPTVTSYRIDIYRVGYYQGLGARQIASVTPSAPLPQPQPACLTDSTTGLVDCGNWAVSASWAVPPDAVSGVYLADFVRTDGTSGVNQAIFVVRNDARNSDILVQTSDATWQAYNSFGGNSLYEGSPAGRAFKVSYNRPLNTRRTHPESNFFDSEYPMIRWLEANSYDVAYTSNVDTATRQAQLLNHKIFMSSGHDEYWSNEMRTNVTNAISNGVNVTFFSGNESFWKTRWENSIDGSGTPFRTMVCYKETLANAKIDPTTTWTGTWRDPRFSPPSDGGRPENAVTGTLYRVNGLSNDSITVPYEDASMRLWRNTSVANLQPGQVAVFPAGTLGYEWDGAPDDASVPTGLVRLSGTTLTTPDKFLLDFGSTYGYGTATHNLTLYRTSGNALVFGAGTTQWAWGLDAVHDRPGTPTDINMKQATVNLFADMGVQPATLEQGLVPATPSTDTAPPTSAISIPTTGASVPGGTVVTISGTAADTGGGVVAGVDVSVDGGTTWHRAAGRTSWQYRWATPTSQTVTIQSRAVDDIGNMQNPTTTRTLTVNAGCPCSIWPSDSTPAQPSLADNTPVELGVRFRATSPGYVSGVRFYKGSLNTGTHVGSLWTADGQLLAQATFTNETASGWQQVNFPTPVPVIEGADYVVSYHTPGNYAVTRPYFTSQYSNGLLTAPANGDGGGNGLYAYSPASTFPTKTYQATNYWVDVVFTSATTLWDDTTTPTTPFQADPNPVVLGVKFQATASGKIRGVRFYKGAQNTGTHVGSLWTADGQLLASATFTDETASGWQQVTFSPAISISAGTTYVASYSTTTGYATDRFYFLNAYTRGPLTAPASGGSGGNGVYVYSAANAFPNKSFQATNYWVDVLFDPDPPQPAARRPLRRVRPHAGLPAGRSHPGLRPETKSLPVPPDGNYWGRHRRFVSKGFVIR
ncbi:N,N-dimethylformamidase beta subunit family domain-containing protein [Microbispora sp. CA-102843]|uniref:N,N-dimethylformamidase beta subunit family domain-containing protein n=1 Tax=Microbispora sp. CA-102843 TaxID=3239952 RepID=UPI003D8E87DF